MMIIAMTTNIRIITFFLDVLRTGTRLKIFSEVKGERNPAAKLIYCDGS